MGTVEVKNLFKAFGDLEVIKDVSLSVPEGSFTVLVGPSGCGKSTLLRLIAGLEDASSGQIMINEKDVTGTQPSLRGIAMVFQSYALYPHMSVRKNMSFGLSLAKMNPKLIDKKVNETADLLQLTELLDRKPKELSGGQRQRVAIGRAIVRKPDVFLFDEPLSNLDASLRGQMRIELAGLHKRLGATMVYVTHDQVEAMTLADQIVVLKGGVIEQVGSPMELYKHPRNRFVAEFIGSPQMNYLDGAIADELKAHGIGIRPEHLSLSPKKGKWKGTIGVSEHLGSDCFVRVELDEGGLVVVRADGDFDLQYSDQIFVTPIADAIHRFDQQGQTL